MIDRLKKWFAEELLKYAFKVASKEDQVDWIGRFKEVDEVQIWHDYTTMDCYQED